MTYTESNSGLYEKNRAHFAAALGTERLESLDQQYIKKRSLQISADSSIYDINAWLSDEKKAIVGDDYIPRNLQNYDRYSSMITPYAEIDNINAYINDDENDPHLLKVLTGGFDDIKSVDFDPLTCVTTCHQCDLFIALDLGDGIAFNQIIESFSPNCIMICVERWEDMYSTFDNIDWMALSQRYKADNRNLKFIRARNYDEIMININDYSLLSVDHAFLLCPDRDYVSDSNTKLKERLTSGEAKLSMSYLGFTMDEYNMVYSSAKTLNKDNKIFRMPSAEFSQFSDSRFVVTGSGPSLDLTFDVLRKLQQNHYIVASASSYGPLIKNNIRVDFLVILERGYDVFEGYRDVHDKYGSNNTIVIRSSVSDVRFSELSNFDVVYFRSSLTPYGVFAPAPDASLIFDAPQAINAGVSFATSMSPKSIVFAGIDLGAPVQGDQRASDALGRSDRNFTIPVRGNLTENVFTEKPLIDSRLQLERLIKSVNTVQKRQSDVQFYNISDGMFIEGAKSISGEDYLLSFQDDLPNVSDDKRYSWFKSLPFYSKHTFKKSWKAGQPRFYVYSTFRRLEEILDADIYSQAGIQISELMRESTYRYKQFPWKIVRGFYVKSMSAYRRQMLIFSSHGCDDEKKDMFASRFKNRIRDGLSSIEKECYQLCDMIEQL